MNTRIGPTANLKLFSQSQCLCQSQPSHFQDKASWILLTWRHKLLSKLIQLDIMRTTEQTLTVITPDSETDEPRYPNKEEGYDVVECFSTHSSSDQAYFMTQTHKQAQGERWPVVVNFNAYSQLSNRRHYISILIEPDGTYTYLTQSGLLRSCRIHELVICKIRSVKPHKALGMISYLNFETKKGFRWTKSEKKMERGLV